MSEMTIPVSLKVHFDDQTGEADVDVIVWEEERREWLRDWFAGMAMQGDWAAQGAAHMGAFDTEDGMRLSAERYYRMADAMLSARSGGHEGDER